MSSNPRSRQSTNKDADSARVMRAVSGSNVATEAAHTGSRHARILAQPAIDARRGLTLGRIGATVRQAKLKLLVPGFRAGAFIGRNTRQAQRFIDWAQRSTGLWILLFAVIGVGLALFPIRLITEACFEATQHWDNSRKQWSPGEAKRLLGFVHVSAELCKDMSKNPPWLLLSSLAAAPCILLTWYWRDKSRRESHKLAIEVAFSERYTQAARLLESADEMTRVNGMESLCDLACQSASHRHAVARTLAAFVRTRLASTIEPPTSSVRAPLVDAQTALTLLGNAPWLHVGTAPPLVELDLRGVNLSGCKLTRAGFDRVDLSDARACDTSFTESSFARANLSRVHFKQVDLSYAGLRGAELSASRFICSKLNDTDFTNANLEGIMLEDVEVLKTCFAGAKMNGARLRATVASSRVDFEGASMYGADLEGQELPAARFCHAFLVEARLNKAYLVDADFTGANIGRAQLEGASLHRACLKEAHLSEAILAHATLIEANLAGASLKLADLQNAQLDWADLRGAELTGADLTGACLTGALYDEHTDFPEAFGDPELRGMRLHKNI